MLNKKLFTNSIIAQVIIISFLTLHLLPPKAKAWATTFSLKAEESSTNGQLFPQRDPFNWPPKQLANLLKIIKPPTASFAKLTLQAIFWDEILPRAIINDNILLEGDKIGDIEIVLIARQKVLLQLGSHQYQLKFIEPQITFEP